MKRLGALLAVLAAVGLAACSGQAPAPPYPTVPPPEATQSQPAPNCGSNPREHFMGSCLPRPSPLGRLLTPPARATGAITGVDTSNNDPITSGAAWKKIAARNRFAIFKVTEGGGNGSAFIDGYAAVQTRLARAAGLITGGYDFVHLCSGSAATEARIFVSRARALGLTGSRTLPPTADVEFGSAFCGARSWIATWVATVKALTGRQPMVYTGAWFWNPNLGSYWPNPSLAYISGYQVKFPFMPAGRSQLDIWQDSDKGFNGYNFVDHDIWEHGGAAAFAAASNLPKPPSKPKNQCFGSHAKRSTAACKKLRPEVSKWSHARDATLRALAARGCSKAKLPAIRDYPHVIAYLKTVRGGGFCPTGRQRAGYFAGKVHQAITS